MVLHMSRLSLGPAWVGVLLLAGSATAAASAESHPLDASLARFDAVLARAAAIPGFPPGFAIVVTDRQGTRLLRAGGTANVATGTPITPDTPFYIASMTKAYLGQLAAQLDQAGVLRLDSTLGQYWPDLHTDSGMELAPITLRQLLTHQAPFEADDITWLEAYARPVPAADYPRLLRASAKPRAPGFKYDNLGYNVYAAVLAQATGRTWQDWLAGSVFAPLGLTRTSARTSTFGERAVTWRHQWNGAGEWEVLPPKSDAIMQSAGGVFTSARDMAAWLRANLAQQGTGTNGPAPAAFAAAQTRTATYAPRKASALDCHGYALGWHTCRYRDAPVLQHGGGYDGVRTYMLLAPQQGVGIGVLTNSDSVTGYLGEQLAQLLLAYVNGEADADSRASAVLARFARDVGRQLEQRQKRAAAVKTDPKWQGMTWAPAAAELAAYAGEFTHPVLGKARITPDGGSLEWKLDAARMTLRPAAPGLFAAASGRWSAPEPVRFERNAAGAIGAAVWNGHRFERTR